MSCLRLAAVGAQGRPTPCSSVPRGLDVVSDSPDGDGCGGVVVAVVGLVVELSNADGGTSFVWQEDHNSHGRHNHARSTMAWISHAFIGDASSGSTG
jgi:hypothetical protein